MPKVRRVSNDKNSEDGLWLFYCPGCEKAHPFDKRWSFNGNVERPTFSPSLLLHPHPTKDGHSPRCHLFVRDGAIQYCGDCEHGLAGQTVPMEDWNDDR